MKKIGKFPLFVIIAGTGLLVPFIIMFLIGLLLDTEKLFLTMTEEFLLFRSEFGFGEGTLYYLLDVLPYFILAIVAVITIKKTESRWSLSKENGVIIAYLLILLKQSFLESVIWSCFFGKSSSWLCDIVAMIIWSGVGFFLGYLLGLIGYIIGWLYGYVKQE